MGRYFVSSTAVFPVNNGTACGSYCLIIEILSRSLCVCVCVCVCVLGVGGDNFRQVGKDHGKVCCIKVFVLYFFGERC